MKDFTVNDHIMSDFFVNDCTMKNGAANYGCRSMIAPIERIILKHPSHAFRSQAYLESNWQALNYLSCPDFHKSLAEYEQFERIIHDHVSHVYYLPESVHTGPDSIYTHDTVKFLPGGAILMHMGKNRRRDESRELEIFLKTLDIPVLGAIQADGRMEGGDVVWLDKSTAAVACGYRTNTDGIRQFKTMIRDQVPEVIVVPLPHADGPSECLHLMSVISLVDTDLAVVYSRYLPVFFRDYLLERGIRLIEVDDHEYETLGCNVLTLAPCKCLMLSGNPNTHKKLEDAGVEVLTYKGENISLKGTGGPTCLTCPVLRLEQNG